MFRVRIDGRGGQGVVSGTEPLSVAGFPEGPRAIAGKSVAAACEIASRVREGANA